VRFLLTFFCAVMALAAAPLSSLIEF